MNRSYSKIRHIQETNIKLEKQVLSEQARAGVEAMEDGIKYLLNIFKKSEVPLAKSVAVKTLPREVELLINKLPTSIKVGEKLGPLLQKNLTKARSLNGGLSRLNQIAGKGMGISQMLASKLEKQMLASKGQLVNLKDMVETSNRLEVELMNIKKSLPKPSGNDSKKINDWYNFLYTELSDIKTINNDFNVLLKNKFN